MSQRPGAPLPIVLVSANRQVGCPQLQFMSLVVPTSAPVSVCPETGAASFLERVNSAGSKTIARGPLDAVLACPMMAACWSSPIRTVPPQL